MHWRVLRLTSLCLTAPVGTGTEDSLLDMSAAVAVYRNDDDGDTIR